ncbi:MAG: EAL domain-containing protein [Pseudomonadales bacterium]|nr:EAL domain-containing protein [Pseudomonadales bacterium]
MKHWYQSLSLHSKQVLVIILINALALCIASTAFLLSNAETNKERELEQIISTSKILEGILTTSLTFQDTHSAHAQLNKLQNNPSVLYVGVYDKDKNFFANYVGTRHFDRPNVDNYALGMSHKEGSVQRFSKVMLDNEIVGYLLFIQDASSLTSDISRHAVITLAVFIVSLLFAYVLSLFMQRWLSKPIKDLVEVIQHITTNKDFDQRLKPRHNDEIGQLINSFNTMLEVIKSRDAKLRKHGEELEDLVNLKTRQLHQRSNYCQLTKLPNRHFFIEQLERQIEVSKLDGTSIAVLFMDLDRFKVINDNLGHEIGDDVLREVAQRLENVLESKDIVARWGGDEFVVFLPSMKKQEDIVASARSIIMALEEVIILDDRQLHISASVGISVYSEHGNDAFTLLKNADICMYRAKQRGAGTFTFYDASIDVASTDRLSMETKLRRALEEGKLNLVYQPKINIQKYDISGVEALLRWHDDELGDIPPSQFIPLAEEIGIINKIGEFVIRTACKQFADWRLLGMPAVRIAINLSPTHLAENDLVDKIQQELAFYNIDPQYLELEITEETFLDGNNQCQKNLATLHDLGFRIAIDDFGTGYSCLSYLIDLPVSTLKIDGSFVRKLGTKPENDGIVSAILTLGHGLGLEVVAECVETAEQLRFLKTSGCDIIQGYYFSKPLSPDDLVHYVLENYPQTQVEMKKIIPKESPILTMI